MENNMSFLSAIGKDFEKVFSFLGSQKGQNIIATGEAVATAIDPALSGVFSIANNWLTEIIKLQALGSAAGDTPGSDTVKSAAVISTLTPQILAWAAANKMPVPDSAQIQTANDALVAFLDAFGAPGASTTTTTAAVKTS